MRDSNGRGADLVGSAMARLRSLALLVLVLVPLLGVATGAQTQQPTFRASTKLVLTTVTVKHPDGTPVEGLTARDFIVTEEGEPQDIAFVDYQRLDNLETLPALSLQLSDGL